MPAAQRIFTPGFLLLAVTNFLLFAAFYMLMPVLPKYLLTDLNVGEGAMGVVVGIYVVSALLVRPGSGMLVDRLPRKGLMLVSACAFAALFAGYIWLTAFGVLLALRFAHGAAFGLATTSINTVAADLLPPERIGTGMGFFGMTNAVSMALGPMAGLMLYERLDNAAFFTTVTAVAAAGLLLAVLVPRTGSGATVPPRVAGRRFALPPIYMKGAAVLGLCGACFGFGYGLVLNYVGVFADEQALTRDVGVFFLLTAAGMIASRLFVGRLIDSGRSTVAVLGGYAATGSAIVLLVLWPDSVLFYVSAVLFGLGGGALMPAFQTLFLRKAAPHQRGLATSSFFTAWDGGIGIALMGGGALARFIGFSGTFAVGVGVMMSAAVLFAGIAAHRRRLKP